MICFGFLTPAVTRDKAGNKVHKCTIFGRVIFRVIKEHCRPALSRHFAVLALCWPLNLLRFVPLLIGSGTNLGRIRYPAQSFDYSKGNVYALPSFFGTQCINFEQLVYSHVDKFCPYYSGGMWDLYALSNGGFFMSYDHYEPLTVSFPENYFEETMSA